MTSKLRPYDEPPRPRRSLIPSAPDSAATAFVVISALWFAAAAGIGALATAQVLLPDLLKASFSVSIGSGITIDVTRATVQPAFLDALIYGWISNAAFAAIFFATPRLTGRRLMSEPLALLGAGAWNVAVAAGVALLYVKGASGSASLSEFPLPVQALALLGLLAINGAFWGTIAAARSFAYVSVLYFGIGLLALLGCMTLAAVPNVVSLGDTNDLLLWAFTARGITTLWVLGAALGTLYYVIPRVTRNPLYSSGLAYLALAGWVVFGGLSAVGALVDPSVPYAVTSLGQAGTLLLLAPVFLAAANMLGTMGGRWTLLFSAGPIPLAVSALAFVTGASLLESVGALRHVQGLIAGTDWSLGVTILSALGGATLAFIAFIEHAAPRLFRRGWSSSFLTGTELWTVFAGVALGGLSMIGGGIIQGSLVAQAASPDAIDATLLLFRLAAAGGLGLVALGSLAMLANLFLLYTSGLPADYGVPGADVSTAAAGH
jgi:cytochrome c oxidase cbb3-type subunit I